MSAENYWPDELSDRPWDATGYHGRYTPEPDGLEHKCEVCGAEPNQYCTNPATNPRIPRRLNVSCMGRKERSS
jgi:hypothetical protein